MPEWETFTRIQLYELVWTTPKARLAEKYSISDVGLAKICKKLKIPTPPRGYWAKLEAGQKPTRPRLRAMEDERHIKLPLRAVSEAANSQTSELAQRIAEAKRPENRIVVAARLRSPSELVSRTKTALESARRDDSGFLARPDGVLAVDVSREQLARALRIADALLKAFEARGWPVEVRGDRTLVVVEESLIALAIEEELDVDEVVPKPNFEGRYEFHYKRRETVRKPSGRLRVTISEVKDRWGYPRKRTWRSTQKHALEERLHEVVIGVLKMLGEICEERAREARRAEEAAERERRRREAEEERRRLREELEAERYRVAHLLDLASRWRTSRDLRDFIEAVRSHGQLHEEGLEGPELERWLDWATLHADRLDPLRPSPYSVIDEGERSDGRPGWYGSDR